MLAGFLPQPRAPPRKKHRPWETRLHLLARLLCPDSLLPQHIFCYAAGDCPTTPCVPLLKARGLAALEQLTMFFPRCIVKNSAIQTFTYSQTDCGAERFKLEAGCVQIMSVASGPNLRGCVIRETPPVKLVGSPSFVVEDLAALTVKCQKSALLSGFKFVRRRPHPATRAHTLPHAHTPTPTPTPPPPPPPPCDDHLPLPPTCLPTCSENIPAYSPPTAPDRVLSACELRRLPALCSLTPLLAMGLVLVAPGVQTRSHENTLLLQPCE